MKYFNYVKKISDTLSNHKATVDNLIKVNSVEIQKHEAELSKMQGIYTPEYIEEYKKNWKSSVNYADAIQKSSERAVLEVELYLGKIKRELDKYFDSPIRQEFANKINAIALTGLSLRDSEFALLVDSASNYMEARLVQQLADSRTKKSTVTDINEQGYSEQRQVTVENPYYVELPDIDYMYRMYNEYASATKTMARNYCGQRAELKDYISGVSEYALLNADSYFRNDAASRFSKEMEKANSHLAESKVKTTLTESERKLIDTLIDSNYPSLAKQRVKALAEANSDIEDLLLLDDRYKGYLEEE